jgi:malonyl CoA-acyl carrier protein transacylase
LYEPRLAFIFPAFVNEYPDDASAILPGFNDIFLENIRKGAEIVSRCIASFDFGTRNFLEDEAKTQLITYIYSCTVADMLNEKGIKPDFITGFSMGLYGALYHAGSITFGTGLQLISKAYLSCIRILASRQFAMGGIIGLSNGDILELIEKNNLSAEITNQNSIVSFTISGLYDEVTLILEKAREEGALHTRLLKASIPYHSKYMEDSVETFEPFVSFFEISSPVTPVVSQIDQSFLSTPELVRKELTRNLFTHTNWMETQYHLSKLGVKSFVECGPGKNLAKNSKFLEGDFRFYLPAEL